MNYIETISWQSALFLKTCGFGFLLGMLFEVFRMFRIIFTNGKYTVFWDVLYMCVASVTTFLFLLINGNGTLRVYVVLGLVLGWIVFYVTVGKGIKKIFDRLIICFRTVISKLSKAFLQPFQRASCKIKTIKCKVAQNFAKKIKKVTKKFKIHLKFANGMLYNSKR